MSGGGSLSGLGLGVVRRPLRLPGTRVTCRGTWNGMICCFLFIDLVVFLSLSLPLHPSLALFLQP